VWINGVECDPYTGKPVHEKDIEPEIDDTEITMEALVAAMEDDSEETKAPPKPKKQRQTKKQRDKNK
jgi:hypothetical protein